MYEHIVVVGASLAGLQAAQGLRRGGYEGTLTIVGDEPDYPYDRPPLSKGFLDGRVPEEKLRLRGAADPEALGVDWRLGVAAMSLELASSDGGAHTIGLSDGSTLVADGIVIATGSSPRRLDGFDLPGVFELRTLADARGLHDALAAGPKRVVVVGAGFIGAEVASTARGLGLEVTLIEAAPMPLARVLDHGAGEAIADLHRGHGVDVRLGTGVASLQAGDNGAVASVTLADGEVIETDLVVVGVGCVPNTAWLEGSGLTIDNGVVCDETCLAAPGIVAAGDVARWPNPRFGGTLTRVEQWDNAVEQGTYVARRLLALDQGDDVEPYAPTPWFWSDQYDRKIQLAGIPTPNAEVVNGSIEEQVFLQIYADDNGSFVGALGWNRPRQAIQARMLLGQGASLDEARTALSD
ncbi:MAG: FAD-dependent oxidoreductase [Acidimicrobiales bacterium]